MNKARSMQVQQEQPITEKKGSSDQADELVLLLDANFPNKARIFSLRGSPNPLKMHKIG